jgi:hypothetical protein
LRKSLAIIASALLLAVAAASHDRLRYDSSVFADAAIAWRGAGQACRISAVQEGRSRGPLHPALRAGRETLLPALAGRPWPRRTAGGGRRRSAPRLSALPRPQRRSLPAGPRHPRGGSRPAGPAPGRRPRRSRPPRAAQTRAAQTRAATRTAVRQQRAAPVVQRQATRTTPAPTRRNPGAGTPGI